jgi:hypothetical protein
VRALWLTVLLAGCGAGEPCFVAEAGSGWRRVPLPAEAPELAAPDGVEQFRSDEPAIVWDTPEVGSRGRRVSGSSLFSFTSEGEEALALEFVQPLGGARVDAVLDDIGQPLMSGKRVAGRTLRLEWAIPGDHVVRVRVHNHLRTEPVVQSLRRGHRVRVRGPTAEYRMPGSLYFRSRGEPLTLCPAPGRTLDVAAESLAGTVEPVRLTPRPRRRGLF